MNEPQFGHKVRQILNQGTQLDEKSLARLRSAREQALKRQKLAAPAAAGAWTDILVGSFGGFTGITVRLILPVAILVGGLQAISGWQQNLRAAEVAELDAMLLTDELPLDAFLDKGFEAWLTKQKRSPL